MPQSTNLANLCKSYPGFPFAASTNETKTVIIQQCDDLSHDYLVPRGWTLKVVLLEHRVAGSSDRWETPSSSNPNVLRVQGEPTSVPDPSIESDRYQVSVFDPILAGKATITARSIDCASVVFGRTRCDNSYLFRVTVEVT